MRWVLLSFVVGLLSVVACSSPGVPALLTLHYDAGSDARVDAGIDSGELDSGGDADPYLGGPCVDDGQCNDNVLPHVLSAVKAYATVGEIAGVLRKVWGEHVETLVV